MAEAKSLLKTLESVQQSIVNIKEFAEKNASKPDINPEDVYQRINRLESMLSKYLEMENKLFQYDASQPSKYQEMEELYYSAMSCLNKMAPKGRQSVQFHTTNTAFDSSDLHNAGMFQRGQSCEIKLPKIIVPQFSGNYTEWQSFIELFNKQIHEREGLSDAQRLQYLKCYLKGEAQSLIMHMSISDANYHEALSKLKGRYDKRRYTINAFIQTFMDQPVIQQSNVSSIKKLYDVSDGVIRGMKSLGTEAESRDPWLIYVLLNKLDVESRILWAQETKNIECPKISRLFEFLAERIDTLETFGMSKRLPVSSKPQAIKSLVTAVVHTKCSLCKGEETHKLHECKIFKAMKHSERLQYVKESHRCFNCLNSNHSVYECRFKSRCQTCHRKHHTLLHVSSPATTEAKQESIETIKNEANKSNVAVPNSVNMHVTTSSEANLYKSNCLSVARQIPNAILPTAIVKLRDRHGNLHTFRALLDSGSESNFITEKCINKLQLSRTKNSIIIKGLGQSDIGRTKGAVEVEVSNLAETYKTKAWSYVVPRISSISTKNYANQHDIDKINQKLLADPRLFESGDIDMLFGVNIFFDCLDLDCTKKIDFENLSAYNTKFGWIIIRKPNEDDRVSSETFNTMVDVDTTLRQFWELENVPNASESTPEEDECERLFQNTTIRSKDGKFVVRLPFKEGLENLGSSYNIALQRLKSVEHRCIKDKFFKQLYHNFMEEYEALGHMTLIGESNTQNYYMPHHGVIKESTTTKLRVVFDASAKSTSNTSLNELLVVGPNFQSSLADILLRFRQHKYVLTGDIEKMYRMVWIHPEDARVQRILWRTESTMIPKEYRLNTVTYGTASAAYLATRSLKEVSLRFENPNGDVANVLLKDVYVDDVMTGSSSINHLLKMKNEIISNLKMYGFNLRKLRSNVRDIIISNHPNLESVVEGAEKEISESREENKVLGMMWDSVTDIFSYQFHPNDLSVHTKRSLLSESSKVFDPLGLLTPITIKIKILFQKLWLSPMKWDDELQDEVKSEWLKIRNSFNNINSIKIPRWLKTNSECTLQGFSDASEAAYGACIYAVTDEEGIAVSRLVVAKARVAPIKQVSLPRLELQAALLLAKLMSWVQRTLTINVKKVELWTDSKIVLDWLSSHPRRWKTFIANRTSEILDTYKFKRECWNHVRSEHNPADCASRGIFLEQLENHHLWWSGPHWLTSGEIYQRKKESTLKIPPQEEEDIISLTCAAVPDVLKSLIERHSSFYRACQALANAIKYIEKLKARIHPELSNQHNPKILPRDIRAAEVILFKYIQRIEFADEYEALKKNQLVPSKSRLRNLHPFIHQDGLMRVGGQIEKSLSSFTVKHPIILPRSQLSKSLVSDYHRSFSHAGIMLCLAMVRRKCWIINCKDVVRAVIRKCINCIRMYPKCEQQLMGTLATSRVQYEYAFANVGIDYCGPLKIHLLRKRGSSPHKAYVCLFVCMATKAVHIEVVIDLTTESFLGALHRFIGRRGLCKSIYSDNGTNFIGAKNHLNEVYQFLKTNNNHIHEFLLRNQISWHLISAGAPHMGGLWEASVKLLKTNLFKVAGSNILTLEEFTTLMVRIEAAINSRPLCKDQQEEIDVITPAHLVIGRSLVDVPEPIFVNKASRWHVVQQIYQHFWKKWHTNYITALQNRCKWRESKENVKVDDVVILADDKSPSLHWPLARVLEVHPGSDGLIRVVTLKLAGGSIVKRPTNKLCILPVRN